MALSRDEQGEVSQPREAETAMPARETAPAIVQNVVVCLSTHLERDKRVFRCPWGWFAARDEIGARAADSVLDHVCQEERQDHAGQPPEQRDVRFMCAWPRHGDPGDEDEQGDGAGVYEEPGYVYALVQGVREANAQVREVEHAVEGLGEELDLQLGCQYLLLFPSVEVVSVRICSR
jgi:hypothetical protein